MDRIAKELISIAKSLTARFVVEDLSQKVAIKPNVRSRANRELDKVTDVNYHRSIPIDDMFGAIEKAGLIPIQEDGTAWSGMLVGREGSAKIRLGYDGMLVKNAMLVITWHKMNSGMWEVVAYVS
jgi:hypothetical protein